MTRQQPDIYDGAEPTWIDSRVRRDFTGQIIPSSETDLPAVPNFSVETNRKAGRADVVELLAMHNGAYGAYAMHSLQNYGSTSPVLDGKAYTVGATYVRRQLRMYASHPVQAAGRPTGADYYMSELDAYAMTGNADGFRQGATAYRNARDWTQARRDSPIADANANAANAAYTAGRPSNSSAGPWVTSLGSSVDPAPRMSSETSVDDPRKRPRREGY